MSGARSIAHSKKNQLSDLFSTQKQQYISITFKKINYMKNSTFLLAAAALFSAATVNAQTPDNPAALDYDPAEVGVIYAADQDTFFEVLRDGNGNAASDWTLPVWGQACTIADDECNDGASAIHIYNLDFLPLQFPSTISLAQWRYLHVDMWVPQDDQVCFKFQNWWPGEAYVSEVYDLKGGEWTSIDIDMEDPENFQWSEVKTDPETQEKYINKGVNVFQIAGEKVPNDFAHSAHIYMTNIIAHNYEPAGVENVLVDEKAADNRIFNIMGVEVDENYQGLVIRNGKKYIQR